MDPMALSTLWCAAVDGLDKPWMIICARASRTCVFYQLAELVDKQQSICREQKSICMTGVV